MYLSRAGARGNIINMIYGQSVAANYRGAESDRTNGRTKPDVPLFRRGGGKRAKKSSHRERVYSSALKFDTHIGSLTQFVMHVAELVANNDEDLILFRGQREFDLQLLPKIGRTAAVKGKQQSDLGRAERRIFSVFKRMGLPFLESQPTSELEWLAIAQHHGLPTRLLDWTGNALAALWFAVRKPPVKEGKRTKPGIVWVLNPSERDFVEEERTTDPFNLDSMQVYRPRHVNRRITAQAAFFTVHPLDKRTSRFKPLETEFQFSGTLSRIAIPAACFPNIRDELERLGVSDRTMFPDLDGVCRFISWNNSLLEDETNPPEKPLNQ